MKNFIATGITTLSLAALAATAPALAKDDHATTADNSTKAETPVVVERNSNGKATKVRVSGKVYDVCMKDDQDGCINPRAAGLNWGNRPLDYWPGKPASKMK
ncbi:hypothetical protein [Erythrobacter sp. MTPC3]|uniref:hypothetical protein n=1 Tax=Erythrobacter sp. MTPC3 TaxID=3056564 RepID=UPI0036F1D04A